MIEIILQTRRSPEPRNICRSTRYFREPQVNQEEERKEEEEEEERGKRKRDDCFSAASISQLRSSATLIGRSGSLHGLVV